MATSASCRRTPLRLHVPSNISASRATSSQSASANPRTRAAASSSTSRRSNPNGKASSRSKSATPLRTPKKFTRQKAFARSSFSFPTKIAKSATKTKKENTRPSPASSSRASNQTGEPCSSAFLVQKKRAASERGPYNGVRKYKKRKADSDGKQRRRNDSIRGF